MESKELVHPENELLIDNSPQGLISQALAQGAGIDTLERLMSLQERWQNKQAESEFLKAMTKFQSTVPDILKTKKGHNSNYATLGNIKKIIQPYLETCGLSYRWEFDDENDKIICYCIISHLSGHSKKSRMKAGKDSSGNKNDIQSIGSTRSYLQRYTLVAAFGLATVDMDDDGNKSASPKEKIPEPKEKIDWSKLIKNCESKKELFAVWNRISQKEQSEHKATFTKINAFIEAENKRSV